ncbi:unnamed protein product [Fructobacillus cardui]|nr:unnamed protein product [Fructobacillus cardui]
MLHLRDIWKTKPFWIFIVLMSLIVLGGNTAIASVGPSPLQQQHQGRSTKHTDYKYQC